MSEQVRRWTVTSCEEFRSGIAKTGKPWTMYVLTATDENGNTVIEGIKSFDRLPLGALDLIVEEREYRGDMEYTVKPVNRQLAIKTEDQGGLAAKVADLEARVDRLERKVVTDVPVVQEALNLPEPADLDEIPF